MVFKERHSEGHPKILLANGVDAYADEGAWRKIIREATKTDYFSRSRRLDWAGDEKIDDFFIKEFRREADQWIGQGECRINELVMDYVVGLFDDVGVMPDLTHGARRKGSPALLHAVPANWNSVPGKVELALRLAFAQSEIPYPDERLPALGEVVMDEGSLVERCAGYAGDKGVGLRDFCEKIYALDFDHDDWDEFQRRVGVWQGAAGWFNYRGQNKRIARFLGKNPGAKKIWSIGAYNGEELAAQAVELEHVHGVDTSGLVFVGTDFIEPNPERIMFARRLQVEHFFGGKALEECFELCGIHCVRPKGEVLDKLSFSQGDITKSFIPDCDVVVANGVLHAIPEKERIHALDNIFSGVRGGGMVYCDNGAWSHPQSIPNALKLIDEYVAGRKDLSIKRRDARYADYEILKT